MPNSRISRGNDDNGELVTKMEEKFDFMISRIANKEETKYLSTQMLNLEKNSGWVILSIHRA